MRILVFNQTDGAGKTTSALNLAAALAAEGEAVTLVDLDPKGPLTEALRPFRTTAGLGAAEWLSGGMGPLATFRDMPGVRLVESDPAALEDCGQPITMPPRRKGHWAILDAPSAASTRLTAVMAASNLVLCPLEPDLPGLASVSAAINALHEAGVGEDRLRILINRYSNRLAVHREVRAKLAERYGSNVILPVVIRNSARLSEAFGLGKTIFNHAPRSTGASDFIQLARALVAQRALDRSN